MVQWEYSERTKRKHFYREVETDYVCSLHAATEIEKKTTHWSVRLISNTNIYFLFFYVLFVFCRRHRCCCCCCCCSSAKLCLLSVYRTKSFDRCSLKVLRFFKNCFLCSSHLLSSNIKRNIYRARSKW